ncbi:hypothetical protein A2T82_14850 [Burkholderia cenocepacia]|nr:hypothetical protein A2T82_14850 [Burkholderia cenocepacia]
MTIKSITKLVDILSVNGLFSRVLREILGFNSDTPVKRYQRTSSVRRLLTPIDLIVEILHQIRSRYLARIICHPPVCILRTPEVTAAEPLIQPLTKPAFDRHEVGANIVHAVYEDRRTRESWLDVDIRMRVLWTVR